MSLEKMQNPYLVEYFAYSFSQAANNPSYCVLQLQVFGSFCGQVQIGVWLASPTTPQSGPLLREVL